MVGDGARKGLIMMVKQSHTRPFSWSSNFRHYLHHLMSPNYFGKSLNLIRNSTVSIIYMCVIYIYIYVCVYSGKQLHDKLC